MKMFVSGDSWSHRKVISGKLLWLDKSMGIIFISVDTERGIFEFDINYNIIRQASLPEGIRAHGVDFSAKHERFFYCG